jgi:hypothetical protein
VTATGQRVGINMISAITPSGQVRFQLADRPPDSLIAFLEAL